VRCVALEPRGFAFRFPAREESISQRMEPVVVCEEVRLQQLPYGLTMSVLYMRRPLRALVETRAPAVVVIASQARRRRSVFR
jgi:hypothetical protein